jgi:hypothetical protein
VSTAEDHDHRISAQPEEFRRGAHLWVDRATDALMLAGHPLYASVTRERLHGSEDVGTADTGISDPNADGIKPPEVSASSDPLRYRELSAQYEWLVDVNDVLSFNVGGFVAGLSAGADAFANQLEQGILTHISDLSEAAGNVVGVGGREFADALLDALESMEFSFNDDGEPNITLVMHPDQVAKLRNVEMTPEQKARHAAIIQRKREEWNATQRRRELPGLGD